MLLPAGKSSTHFTHDDEPVLTHGALSIAVTPTPTVGVMLPL